MINNTEHIFDLTIGEGVLDIPLNMIIFISISVKQQLTIGICLLCKTSIDQYPGKTMTQNSMKKKPKNQYESKPVTKTKQCESFFNFFSSLQVPDDDEELDEETVSRQQFYASLSQDHSQIAKPYEVDQISIKLIRSL